MIIYCVKTHFKHINCMDYFDANNLIWKFKQKNGLLWFSTYIHSLLRSIAKTFKFRFSKVWMKFSNIKSGTNVVKLALRTKLSQVSKNNYKQTRIFGACVHERMLCVCPTGWRSQYACMHVWVFFLLVFDSLNLSHKWKKCEWVFVLFVLYRIALGLCTRA